MKIIGAYFSPSGGTKRATQLLCGLFGDYETLDLGGRERAKRQFEKDELLVLALPVYAGQIPAVPVFWMACPEMAPPVCCWPHMATVTMTTPWPR